MELKFDNILSKIIAGILSYNERMLIYSHYKAAMRRVIMRNHIVFLK